MSDAPERIWAYAGTFKMWRDHKTDAPHKQTEYIRADINAELLEALEGMRRQFSPYPSEDTERWREEHAACEVADAAIARAKGGTQ